MSFVVQQMSSNIDRLNGQLEVLSRSFSAHTTDEMQQYKAVAHKLDKLFIKSDQFAKTVEEFHAYQQEFKTHLSSTISDHKIIDGGRFLVRFSAWLVGALASVAGLGQIVIPLIERLIHAP